MQICYVDEAGDTGAFDPTNPLSQPVLVLTGVFIRQEQLAQLTRDVMLLKQRFFPNRKFGGVTVLATGKDILRTAIFGNR